MFFWVSDFFRFLPFSSFFPFSSVSFSEKKQGDTVRETPFAKPRQSATFLSELRVLLPLIVLPLETSYNQGVTKDPESRAQQVIRVW